MDLVGTSLQLHSSLKFQLSLRSPPRSGLGFRKKGLGFKGLKGF